MTTQRSPITEYELVSRLRVKYPAPAYAVLPQIRSCTGYGPVRTADALIMSLWPSRGLHLTGVEIKCSRSDWVRELRAPVKAEPFFPHLHFMYLLAANPEIVQPGELPPTWGLMTSAPRGIRIAKEAQKGSIMPLPYWGIVEIMGHSVTAGYISEVTVAGAGYIQVEIPDGPDAFEAQLSHGSIFSLRKTTEEEARAFASRLHDRTPALPSPIYHEDDPEDDPDDADDQFTNPFKDQQKGLPMSENNEVSIKDLDKAEVVAALYNASHPNGLGYFLPNRPMSAADVRTFMDERPLTFDYLKGRVMKVDLTGDTFDPRLYDRDNGDGAAAKAIADLRARLESNHPAA